MDEIDEKWIKQFEARLHSFIGSEEFERIVEDCAELQEHEYQIDEPATWIGKTGLPEEWERELPRYLRREFGESIFDDGSLKAHELEYLGEFEERHGSTHFWKIPHRSEPTYAYIGLTPEGQGCFGWGDMEPPK